MTAATGAALGGRAVLPRALGAAGAALLGLLVIVAAPFALLGAAGGGSGSGPQNVPTSIPSAFVPIYREAARVFGLNWLVIAAIHKYETGFSTHPTTYHGLNFAGCCAGPFQMNLTNGPPSTWDSFRNSYKRGERPEEYPHRTSDHPSPYDNFDAAMAAGGLLKANGADGSLGERTRTAVRDYNGAGPVAEAYAEDVMGQARRWASEAEPPTSASVEPVLPDSGRMTWPVRGALTSPFGTRWGRLHAGIDIGAPTGARILAAATGRVATRGPVSGYGLYTCLEHSPPYSTCYAHQSRLGPTPSGGIVFRGALVGYVGCTGHCYGPHLHFEVRRNGEPVDPMPFLSGRP